MGGAIYSSGASITATDFTFNECRTNSQVASQGASVFLTADTQITMTGSTTINSHATTGVPGNGGAGQDIFVDDVATGVTCIGSCAANEYASCTAASTNKGGPTCMVNCGASCEACPAGTVGENSFRYSQI